MLSRYQMKRGVRASDLPAGNRQDTRKHTRHILRPESDAVARYLSAPSDAAWKHFAAAYVKTVEARRRADPARFDELAALAQERDVFLGCSCPTKKNPAVMRCHTWLALQFMERHYGSDLDVRFPAV